jgi:hypothetical protein
MPKIIQEMKTPIAPLTEKDVNSILLANGHFKRKRKKSFSLMNWEYQTQIRKLAETQLREWLTRGAVMNGRPQDHVNLFNLKTSISPSIKTYCQF